MGGLSVLAASRGEASAALIASRDEAWLQRLQDRIRHDFGLPITGFTVAPRGWYAETWRITSPAGDYFVKLDFTGHQQRLRESLPVLDHLSSQGINFIPRPIRTADDRLFADLDDGTLAVFDWVPGHNAETDQTKPAEYDLLAQVYAVPLGNVAIPRFQFSGNTASQFLARWAGLERGSPVDRVLNAHREIIERRIRRLDRLAAICRGDESGFYATHGDAGGNFMTDGDHCHIVDWDEIQLAPPERDAWVMCTKPWARVLFNDALKRHGVDYVLKTERIAYFCYHMVFFYLAEVLSGWNKTDPAVEVQDLLEGWSKDRLEWADEVDLDDNRH